MSDVHELVVEKKGGNDNSEMVDKAMISLKEEQFDKQFTFVSGFTKTSGLLNTECEFLIEKLRSVKKERNGLKKKLSDTEAECKCLVMVTESRQTEQENNIGILKQQLADARNKSLTATNVDLQQTYDANRISTICASGKRPRRRNIALRRNFASKS